MSTASMRITGGRWRSRALKAPTGMTTRPTSDRVREALFSMLVSKGLFGEDETSRVLDLYAGSGALAFEALSRGASAAVLVEQARDAVTTIRDNARALEADTLIRLFDTKVERALGRIEGPFGVIFLDPPYADVVTPGFAEVLDAAAALLAPAGALVLEHGSSDPPPAIEGLDLDRSRRYGDTTLSLYQRPPRPNPEALPPPSST